METPFPERRAGRRQRIAFPLPVGATTRISDFEVSAIRMISSCGPRKLLVGSLVSVRNADRHSSGETLREVEYCCSIFEEKKKKKKGRSKKAQNKVEMEV